MGSGERSFVAGAKNRGGRPCWPVHVVHVKGEWRFCGNDVFTNGRFRDKLHINIGRFCEGVAR